MNFSHSQLQTTRSFKRLQLMALGAQHAENFFLKMNPGGEQNNNRFFSFAEKPHKALLIRNVARFHKLSTSSLVLIENLFQS